VQVNKQQRGAWKQNSWSTPRYICSFAGLLIAISHNTASAESKTGFLPFASFSHTYDSNLLNRPNQGVGAAPQSDQINRFEFGTHINFQLSRQQFSGMVSFSDSRHAEFEERNVQGNAYRLRWDSEIGKTLVLAVEGSAISDQAPIQTGQVLAVERDQDNLTSSLTWNFHPEYAVLSQISRTETRFLGPENSNNITFADLNRDDELASIGLEFHPGTGSSIAILQKKSSGNFPIRQITGPMQSVSNDFDQNETELLTKWNYSEITTVKLSLSSVQREHREMPARDFSGSNYRLELLYKPTEKTSFTASWAKQIIGISDVTNSDALARQFFLSMNMQVASKTMFRLGYLPQKLQFDGTDGLSTQARTEKLKETSLNIEHKLTERATLGALLRNRSRDSSLSNADYSANSFSVFVKYEY
jgi:hypothetical protein